MNARDDMRRQVKAQIIKTIADAQASGLGDGVAAARRAYPGTPDSVLYECWADLDQQQEDAWWEHVERTIDGEIIRNAIAVPMAADGQTGSHDEQLDEAFEALSTSGDTEGPTTWPA